MEKQTRKAAAQSQLSKRLANLQNGRDEMNLCELPFATLSERAGHRKRLHFEIEDFDCDLKQVLQRTLTVNGDPEYGLPTEKDEEIFLGLLKYTSDYNGCSDPEVHFSRAELFELMGWQKTNWAYSRLTTGMHRLVGVRLSYQNLWRDNSDKQWRDQGAFGILDSFAFRDCRTGGGGGASFCEHYSMFRWSAVLFQSFDSGYLKRIDYGLARNLSARARRLYRYLDKHFHPPHKTRIVLDLNRLAYQHIGVSPGIEPDKARKRYIAPAAEELEQAGYLRNMPMEERFEKVRRGEWNVTFELATGNQSTPEKVAPAAGKLVTALCKRGVSETKAAKLVREHSRETLTQAMRAMDEQNRNGNTIRSPERWLKAAIAGGFRSSVDFERSIKRPELRLFRRGQFES